VQGNSQQLAMNGNGGGAAAALGGLYQQHQTPQQQMGGMMMHAPAPGSGSGSSSVSTHHVGGASTMDGAYGSAGGAGLSAEEAGVAELQGRGLHSSTFQLNLSSA